MNIAIIGYGKMGRILEEIAVSRGHQITVKITSKEADFSPEVLKDSDVAIEFSVPQAAIKNIKKCFDAGVPVVVGTTGWFNELPQVSDACSQKNGGLFWASNFSIGVNMFFKINTLLAKLMNDQPSYGVSMKEIHHTQKLDSPSGTALTIAEQIIGNLERKSGWTESNNPLSVQIPITAERIENVPGTHMVTYENDIDKIEIMHEAKGRKGFGMGAILAAEFMYQKTGVYTMSDLLSTEK